MKASIYFDVYSGVKPEHIWFTTQPGPKSPGVTRCVIEVIIPDDLINHPDVKLGSVIASEEKAK